MSLRSMTGFARHTAHSEVLDWSWEIKTVNNRGRDVRFRLPSGCEVLETKCRKLIATYIHRGSCQVTLEPSVHQDQSRFSLNKEAMNNLKTVLQEAKEILGEGEISLDGLLQLRGVLDVSADNIGPALCQVENAVLESLEMCLKKLVEAREGEGRQLLPVLEGYFAEISAQIKLAEQSPAKTVEGQTARIKAQIARLAEEVDKFDEDRLHQEAVLIAVKADISEEVERIKAHIVNGLSLLKSGLPAGRKLDFLSQELNREANTICSKSVSQDITEAGLEIKIVVDQLKEQIQNIE